MDRKCECPKHHEQWLPGEWQGRRRCAFYIPELGASEDYGCPQDEVERLRDKKEN